MSRSCEGHYIEVECDCGDGETDEQASALITDGLLVYSSLFNAEEFAAIERFAVLVTGDADLLHKRAREKRERDKRLYAEAHQ